MPRQIIAIGGGGFLYHPGPSLLDDYILRTCNKEQPRICFIPTACGDAEYRILQFYQYFRHFSPHLSHLSLFRGDQQDIGDLLLQQDILYVSGGNTRNMLALWREWGVDALLRKAYRKGVLLCGVSAGAICWFEQGLTDSVPGQLSPLECLGLLPGSNCPHFDSEAARRPVYSRMIAEGLLPEGIAIDDHCALHYVDERLHKVVSAAKGAKAYIISGGPSQPLRTQTLTPEYLNHGVVWH